jgi:glycosyltransferase involved in cell wall biosynthesis
MRLVGCMMTTNNMPYVRVALESLRSFVDEILVIDGGSTDGTVECAKSLGCRVIHRQWPGTFSAQRQGFFDLLVAEKLAGHEDVWALLVDSDEIVVGGLTRDDVTRWSAQGFDNIWVSRKWLVSHNHRLAHISSSPHTPDWARRLIRVSASVRSAGIIHDWIEGVTAWAAAKPEQLCLLHMEFLISDYETRKRKVMRYSAANPVSGYPAHYLYEDYGYRLKNLSPSDGADLWAANIRSITRTNDRGNLLLEAIRYWVLPRSFGAHVYRPLKVRVKEIALRTFRPRAAARRAGRDGIPPPELILGHRRMNMPGKPVGYVPDKPDSQEAPATNGR